MSIVPVVVRKLANVLSLLLSLCVYQSMYSIVTAVLLQINWELFNLLTKFRIVFQWICFRKICPNYCCTQRTRTRCCAMCFQFFPNKNACDERERENERTNKFVRSIVLVLHFQSDTVDFAFGIKNNKLFLLFIICFGFSFSYFWPSDRFHCSICFGQIAQILDIFPVQIKRKYFELLVSL